MTDQARPQARVVPGQVWRERDQRFTRDITILAIEEGRAVVQAAEGSGPRTRVRLDRFGRAYDLRQDVADDTATPVALPVSSGDIVVGQVWRDRDTRDPRLVKILAIEGDRVRVIDPSGRGVTTRISIARLPKAFDLVRDVPRTVVDAEDAEDDAPDV